MATYSSEFYNDQDWRDSQEDAAKNARKMVEEEANRAYRSTVNQLGAEERATRADYPLLYGQLQTSIGAQKTPLTQEKEESLSDYARQERNLGLSTKGAINTASRTWNELMTAMPKYAGTSAAGAYGEILGRETARQIGQAKQTETLGMQDIGEAKVRVVKFYQQKIQDIEAQGNAQLVKLQQDFKNSIDKINTLRRVAEDDKKSMRLQALYGYQGKISEIRSESAANKLALNKWVYEKNQELANRASSGNAFTLSERLNRAATIGTMFGLDANQQKELANYTTEEDMWNAAYGMKSNPKSNFSSITGINYTPAPTQTGGYQGTMVPRTQTGNLGTDGASSPNIMSIYFPDLN